MLPPGVITLRDAIDFFKNQSDAKLIPNRKTGVMRGLSAGEMRLIVSHTTTAVRAASGSNDPLAVELAPYLEVLVEFAKRDAEAHGRSAKREASSVRLFLAVVEGREPKTRRRVRRDAILPAWLPLYDALTNLRDSNGNRRSPRSVRYPGYLYAMQSFMQLRGINSPRQLPPYERICGWAETDDVSRKALDNWFTAYRTARSQCDLSLPDLARSPIGWHRGLRGLENLNDLVEQALRRNGGGPSAARAGTAHDAGQMELIELLAPRIGEAVKLYLAHTQKSAAWNESVVTATSCMVAELVRMGRCSDLHELDHIALYESQVEVQIGASRATSVGLLQRHLAGFDGTGKVSLLRAFVDAAARRSFDSSPIELRTTVPEDEVPWYTAATFNDLSVIWAVTKFVYGHGAGAPEGGMARLLQDRWARIRIEYDLLRQHMKDINGARQSTGHKAKGMLDFTWATLVCAGLSRLWRQADDLRNRYQETCYQHDGDSPVRKKARMAYHHALKDYVLAAILLDDGLRIRNYALGRVGVNFVPRVERAADGTWQRITGVTTRFRGYDPEAGLKIKRDAGGSERERTRSLLPGIVDMDLLSDYWLDARPYDLVACGLIESVEAYDPDADRFALFISPQSTRSSGAYSPPTLSKRFGKFVHGFMRDVLGRDVPAWSQLRGRSADPILKKTWRGLFNAHPARLFIGSYVGGIRDQWARASTLTNDAIATLQKHYTEVRSFYEDAKGRSGIEHPNHFDHVVDAIWEGEVIDWRAFDPSRPNDALREIDPTVDPGRGAPAG